MAGLDPAIQAPPFVFIQRGSALDARVDPRIKSGDVHDGGAQTKAMK
jgi:hypothetical protein